MTRLLPIVVALGLLPAVALAQYTDAADATGTSTATTRATADYFLKLNNTVVEVERFSFGVSNFGANANASMGAGKVSVRDLSVMKKVDKATPLLMQAAFSGE